MVESDVSVSIAILPCVSVCLIFSQSSGIACVSLEMPSKTSIKPAKFIDK